MRGEPPSGSAKRDYIAAFCPSELSHKFSSKQDLLTYMSDHRKLTPFLFMFDFIGQYYVPPPSSCNRDFLRQVLNGEKKLLKVSECKFVNVPKFDELGTSHIFPKFLLDKKVMQYL